MLGVMPLHGGMRSDGYTQDRPRLHPALHTL